MVAKARMRRPGETVFCATRYGNVMASRGSVIPLFVDQMKGNKNSNGYRSEYDEVSNVIR